MKPSTVETPPRTESHRYIFREARVEDATAIVSCYESVFGRGGIRAPGHEAYPAPAVFTEDGVHQLLQDTRQQFMVIEIAGEIAAGMVISHNSGFHREFGCVAVAKKFQGRGISTMMLNEAKQLERRAPLSINVTEIVTHSMLSQSAHSKAGYDLITGFGFCQYPKVFFLNHPESCLWITSFEGSVIEALRKSRLPQSGEGLSADLIEQELDFDQYEFFKTLSEPRPVYVPETYFKIVSRIASQFEDTFTYRIYTQESSEIAATTVPTELALELDECGDHPYAYLNFPAGPVEEAELLRCVQSFAKREKRYIQARIGTKNASAINNIDLLRRHGFVFLGWVPAFRVVGVESPQFDDVLLMQWIQPKVVQANELPGGTNAVIKLHGYPVNLTGSLIATIRQDLIETGGME